MAKEINRRLNIYINGKEVSNTLNGVGKEMAKLRGQVRNLTRGTDEYNKKSKELQRVSRLYRKMRQEITGVPTLLQRMTKGANAFVTAFGVGFGLQRLIGGLRNLGHEMAVLSDAQADVQKTTELSAKGVEELTARLDKLKTRSTRLELLGLAEEAGRLGKKSVDDVEAFVKVADKIKVALGDDLGGDVNDNIRVIGKLAEQYKVAERNGVGFGDSLEMIGSAINEVSASGSAQAGFLVDYLARVSGVSKQVNIAAQEQIGFAAALDEAGQSVEVSGTTVNKILVDMFSQTDKYAKIAGKSTKDFSALLKKDANEAFLLFLEGLDKNQEGLQSMVGHFEELGIGSTRNIAVLTSLAGNIDKIREKQDLANTALGEGTSLTNEFNTKNATLGALLDRIQNRFKQIYQDGGIKNFLTETVRWFARLVGAVDDTDGRVKRTWETLKFGSKILAIITVSLFSYRKAVQLATLWETRFGTGIGFKNIALKASNLFLKVGRGATLLYSAAKFALMGNTKKATQALRVFNLVTKLSPIGLLVGAIAAASAAYLVFNNRAKNAYSAQKQINKLNNQAEKSIAGQRAELDKLLLTARNENASKEKRIEAIKKLNELSPEYLGGLSLENINTLAAKKSTDQYIESLKKAALEKALASKREELYTQLIEAENSSLAENGKWYDGIFSGINAGAVKATKAFERKSKAIKNINQQLQDLDQYQKSLDEDAPANPSETPQTPSPSPAPSTPDKEGGEELTPEDKKIIASKKKLAEFIQQWEEDQALQKELKDLEGLQRQEEEEVLKLEQKLAKMEEEAGILGVKEEELSTADRELKKQLEELREKELSAIRDKYDKIRVDQKTKVNKKLSEEEEKFHQKLIAAEDRLNQAKKRALAFGISALKDSLDKKSGIYKLLLALEKGLAIGEVVTNTSKANATALANEAKVPIVIPVPFPPFSIPNPVKAISAAATAKTIAANKINAAVQIASIAGSAIKGFKDGGFTTGLGFRDQTGEQVAGVVHVDEYVVPRAVLQSNDPAVPAVVQYLEAKRQNQATPFVDGGATSPDVLPATDQSNGMMEAVLEQITRFNELLDGGITTGPILIGDQKIEEFDERKEELLSVRNQAKVE